MNIRTLPLVGLYLLAASFLLYAADMSAKDYADKYYDEFSKPQDDGISYLMGRFHSEVPASMQTEVLDQVLDRAASAEPKKNYRAMDVVFKYLQNFGQDLTLTPQIDSNLYALAKDSNWMTRRDVLQVVRALGRTKDHDLIVAALNDPSEEVRGAALNALRGRPDAEAAYQKFIQDHQSDPNYATSVQYAKGGLEAIHEAQKNTGK